MNTVPVIIADDDPSIRTLLARHLRADVEEVYECADGREALERLAELKDAVVIVDLEMPGQHGLDVTRAIRQLRPEGAACVLVLTASGSEETAVAALDAGADNFLRKPPSFPELRAHVRAGRRLVAAWRADQQRHEELEQLIEYNPCPMVTVDCESKAISRANQAALRLSGYTKEQFLGRTCKDSLCASKAPECPMAEEEPGAVQHTKCTLQTPDGRSIPVLRSMVPVILGGRRQILESFTDISQLTEAVEARQSQLTFLETLLDTIPSPIYYKNRQGVYQGCNAAFAQWIGLHRTDIIGRTVDDLYPPELTERYRAADDELFAHPGHQVYEFQLDHVSGERRDVLFHKATYTDGQGDVAGLVGVIVDITSRKRAELALQESELRHRSITEAAHDAIITADAQGRIRFWNAAATRVFGYESSEAIGQNMLDLIIPQRYHEDKTRGLRCFADTGQGPMLGNSQRLAARRKDGHEIPVEIALNHYRDQTGYVAVALVRDITEHLEAEHRLQNQNAMIVDALEKEKRVSTQLEATMEELAAAQQRLVDASRQAGMAEVATGILHDVGNVLNSVNVSAAMANERVRGFRTDRLAQAANLLTSATAQSGSTGAPPDQQKKLAAYLEQLAAHWAEEQAGLLGELTTLCSHLDHVKAVVKRQQEYAGHGGVAETFSLTDTIDDALTMIQAGLERYQITVERDYRCRPQLVADRHKLAQVLLNLITNARDALIETPPGHRRLVIRVEPGEDDTAQVEIHDTGVGIKPDDLSRLFDYGFTTKQHGHGFGLHHSALSAKSLGGSLTATSAGPNQGATFTLRLPVKPRSESND